MNLTHRQLEILIAAAESESFSAAAQRLGISQPSLSESIRRIEREIGAPLFERTTRSLKLTAEGRLRRRSRAKRCAISGARSIGWRPARATAKAGSRSRRCHRSPAPRCRRRSSTSSASTPAIEIALHDVQHERALLLVNEGIADLAVTIKPAQHDDLAFEEIASDVAHLVCRNDDPLARRKRVGWRDLSGLPFIGITRISSVRRLTDAAFVHAEIAIEPRYEVEQIPSAVALVEAGLGVTALPSLTFSMFKGRNLAVRPLVEPRLRRNVGFVTLAGRTLPSHCEALMQAIRQNLLRQLRARASQA